MNQRVPIDSAQYPRSNSDFADIGKAIERFVIDPKALPPVTADTRFFLQGSCFTEHLADELRRRGRICNLERVTEALNSPLANFHYWQTLPNDDPNYSAIQNSDLFILTIGVAPCWFWIETGKFAWWPKPHELHKAFMRTLTVAECCFTLSGTFDAIYKINPNIDIMLTLSPVPLTRTTEFESPIVADCLSKSTLRCAMHETMMGYKGKKPYYFPSFEIVRWLGAHRGDAFAADDGQHRHVSKNYVSAIVSAFLDRQAI